jgi:hypothetical protein
MNDFTKSELAVIHLAIIRDMNQFSHILNTSPSMIALRDKLESMIDNYCEHESDGDIWEGNSDNNMPDEYRCKKCGKFYL